MTQGINAQEYDISIPYTVNSGRYNGIQIALEEKQVPVRYEYIAALDKEGRVMLTTIIDSVNRYILPDSEATVYLGETLIGNRLIRSQEINTDKHTERITGPRPDDHGQTTRDVHQNRAWK